MTYQYENLSSSIKVCISKEHRFGTDAILLADFCAARHKDLVCDLGTGCGIVPFALYRNDQPALIYGLDIQEQAIEQFMLGVEASALEQKLIPLCADLKELPPALKTRYGQFDIVSCNPPYKAGDTGILSDTPAKCIARHEIACTTTDVCEAASKLLKFGGRFCVCQRPERLADVICAMRGANLEPKRLRFVSKSAGEEPWLFLLEGKKGSKPFLRVEPPLFLYCGEEYTDELKRIYRIERE